MDKLQALVQLPVGWDGYKAPPVTLENVYFTLQMLKAICPAEMDAPQIVPGSRGDLQVEWHAGDTVIELHVHSPNSVTAWRQSPAFPDGEELQLTNDFLIVLQWTTQLLGDRIAAVSAAA